jgi:hypothetical protein
MNLGTVDLKAQIVNADAKSYLDPKHRNLLGGVKWLIIQDSGGRDLEELALISKQ